MIDNQEKGYCMDYQATIKELPSCAVFSKVMTVPDYSAAYFEVVPALGRAVKAANPDLKCATPEYCFIEYLDGEYKEHDITMKYSEAVEWFGVETDGIVFEEVPAATVVSVMHRGSYADLPSAYAFAMEWVEQNGYRVAGLFRESYIEGVWSGATEVRLAHRDPSPGRGEVTSCPCAYPACRVGTAIPDFDERAADLTSIRNSLILSPNGGLRTGSSSHVPFLSVLL